MPVADVVRAAVPRAVADQVTAAISEARTNPTGDKRFGGESYFWWANAADITPAKALLNTSFPVLFIHGSHDQNAPVAAARAARDLFESNNRRNVTYREYAGYDHFMTDESGKSHRMAVLRETSAWLRANRREKPDRP